MRSRQSGFSLIELMVVVAIIGILAAVAVPSYQSYIAKATTAKLMELGAQYKTAVSLCLQDKGAANLTADCANGVANIPEAISALKGNIKVSKIVWDTTAGTGTVTITAKDEQAFNSVITAATGVWSGS